MYRYSEEIPQSGWHLATRISVESIPNTTWSVTAWVTQHQCVPLCIKKLRCIISAQWCDPHTFQHDGAIAPTVNNSVATLCNIFWDHIISHPLWPAHRSHVMPDHFLWGSLEDNTCKNNSHAQNTFKSSHAQQWQFINENFKNKFLLDENKIIYQSNTTFFYYAILYLYF